LAAKPVSAGRRTRASRPVPDSLESQAAIALTVGWMLTTMSTLVALLVAGAVGLAILVWPTDQGREHPLSAISGLMLLVSAATGVVCIALTPFVYRVRRSPPPRTVTVAAVLIGLAPLVTIAVFALRG
jgi:heme/copper-type cytochrome/quinol oxidase subunit 2